MTGRFLALLGWLAGCAALRGAELQPPYAAEIVVTDVDVRSGPGFGYYATMKLQPGDEVEVYRHDPGGWCAIRPPAGSFSWVSGDFLRPLEDDLAEVIGRRVCARVGSSFSDIRDVIQLRLDQGDVVEVYEVRRAWDGPDAPLWYKIAPPAGEFRWVSRKALRPRGAAVAFGEPDEDYAESAYEESAVYLSSGEAAADEEPPRWQSDPPAPAAEADAPAVEEVAPGWRSRSGAPASPRARALSSDEALRELTRLEIALAREVARDPADWDLGRISREAADLAASVQGSDLQTDADDLLRRAERCYALERRQTALAEAAEPAGNPLDPLPNLDRGAPPAALAAVEAGPLNAGALLPRAALVPPGRHDAAGRLIEVAAREPNDPRYALLDAAGQPFCYVTPAPGVNLRPYLNQDVAVTGMRGYAPRLSAPHVTAKRVEIVARRD